MWTEFVCCNLNFYYSCLFNTNWDLEQSFVKWSCAHKPHLLQTSLASISIILGISNYIKSDKPRSLIEFPHVYVDRWLKVPWFGRVLSAKHLTKAGCIFLLYFCLRFSKHASLFHSLQTACGNRIFFYLPR